MLSKIFIVDEGTGNPIPFASIWGEDEWGDKTGDGATANSEGLVTIDLDKWSPDVFYINCSSVGYSPVYAEFREVQSSVNFYFELERDEKELGGVTVTSKPKTVKINPVFVGILVLLLIGVLTYSLMNTK